MRLAVIVATYGRRSELEDLLGDLGKQTRCPDVVVVSLADEIDVDVRAAAVRTEVVRTRRRGSCAQRNAGIEHLGDRVDVLVFFDDDFVPHETYLERLEAVFARDPGVAGVTGGVVADGVCGPGLSRAEALAAVERYARSHREAEPVEEPVWSLYGCNMAIRARALRGRRFDEQLPLYGWLEDMDLSVQLKDCGRLIRARGLIGAHRGVKKSRSRGVPLGYSQIANPIYLWRKGTVPSRILVENILISCTANLLGSLRPEPYIDRRGRLRGNILALADAVRRRSTPARVLEM